MNTWRAKPAAEAPSAIARAASYPSRMPPVAIAAMPAVTTLWTLAAVGTPQSQSSSPSAF
ncbi:MAG: hypothetical protein H6722_10450 [Sandaracinus sp.]|nr:hypothetical protein [Sandaracinus sp.]